MSFCDFRICTNMCAYTPFLNNICATEHSEKRVPKQHPQGCYLTVRNLALLGVLFWQPTDRGVLFSHKKGAPRGAKIAPFKKKKGYRFQPFFCKTAPLGAFFPTNTIKKHPSKKGAICSNSTPGALFWYPSFLSEGNLLYNVFDLFL